MDFISHEAMAALISGGFSIVTLIISTVIASKSQKKAAKAERELAVFKANAEQELAVLSEKLKNPMLFAAQNLARSIFDDPKYPNRLRSFATFQRRIAGFADDELRRVLASMGATRVRLKGDREGCRLPPDPPDPDE